MVVAESRSVDKKGAELVDTLISLGVAVLEEIVIDRSVNGANPESFDLFAGFAPRPKVASFTLAPGSVWRSSALRNLLALDIDGGIGLSVKNLLTRVIPLSPNLVHLCERGEMPAELPATLYGLQHLILPALKTIYIDGISGRSLAYVLGSVQVPSIDWLKVEYMGGDMPNQVYQHFGRIVSPTSQPSACSILGSSPSRPMPPHFGLGSPF